MGQWSMIWGFGASAHVWSSSHQSESVTCSEPLASAPTRSAAPGCLASVYLGIDGPGQKRMRTASWQEVGGSCRTLGWQDQGSSRGADRMRLLPSFFQVPLCPLASCGSSRPTDRKGPGFPWPPAQAWRVHWMLRCGWGEESWGGSRPPTAGDYVGGGRRPGGSALPLVPEGT